MKRSLRGGCGLGGRLLLATVLATSGVVVSPAALTPAAAAPSKRELQAREAYAAGRFAEALDLFAKLYAETLHPTYLRNIGRCHQNLGDPDKAIAAFREYLRKAKNLPASEKDEVQGFIAEMEELKRQRDREAAAAAQPTPPPREPAPPPPDLTPPPPPAEREPVLTAPAADRETQDARPVYKKWWFWAAVGGVAAATVVGLGAAGVFTRTKNASCPDNFPCR